MKKDEKNPIRNSKIKGVMIGLIVVGSLLIIGGIAFCVVSVVSMGSGNMEFPYFGFIGIPLLFVGSMCLMFGILGPLTKFMQNTVAPLQRNYINYMREETAESAKGYYSDIASGVKEGLKGTNKIVCPNCKHENEEGAKFCNQCGQALNKKIVCPRCGNENAEGSSFCSKCGERLSK